jgi:hypothetical protein
MNVGSQRHQCHEPSVADFVATAAFKSKTLPADELPSEILLL